MFHPCLIFAVCICFISNPVQAQVTGWFDPLQPNHKSEQAPRGIASATSSKFRLLFEKDSAEIYSAGLDAYMNPVYAGRMDLDGNGIKELIYSIHDTVLNTVTTTFVCGNTYAPVWTVTDTGFADDYISTQLALTQFTGASPYQISFWNHNPAGVISKFNAPIFHINDPLSDTRRFQLLSDTLTTNVIIHSGYRTETGYTFDMTGDELLEVIGASAYYEPGKFIPSARYVVFNDFQPIDTIFDERAQLLNNAFSSTLDINQDGKPEFLSARGGMPRLYQYNVASKQFALTDTLPQMLSLYRFPENFDADGAREYVARIGIGGDTIAVFNANGSIKYRLPCGIVQRYFIANINASPNMEIIVVSYGGKAGTGNLTRVFDLSQGIDPIKIDSFLDAHAVADLLGSGSAQLLGIGPSFGYRMVDPMNGYSLVWDLVATGFEQFGPTVGPLVPDDLIYITRPIVSFSQGPRSNIQPVDFDQDGVLDFVLRHARSGKYDYLVVNAQGKVLDTISNLTNSIAVLAHDLNSNGTPEMLISEYETASLSAEPFRSSVLEWQGVESVREKANSELRLYPNPATTWVALRSAARQEVRIVDVLGRICQVASSTSVETVLDLSSLTPGLYQVLARQDDGSWLGTTLQVSR